MSNYLILTNPYKQSGEGYIKYARELGFVPILYFDDQKENIINQPYFTGSLKDYVTSNEYLFIFNSNVDEVCSYIKSMGLDIKGVIPCTEPGILSANKLARLLELIGNDPDTIDVTRNKYKMRQVLKEHSLNHPNFIYCNTISELEKNFHKVGFPCVIKTPEGAGTNHIYLCNDMDTLKAKFNIIVSHPNLFSQYSDSALIEGLIDGDEYAVDAIAANNGIHIVSILKYNKINRDGIHFLYETVIGCDIQDPAFIDLFQYLQEVIKAMNIRVGLIHAELKINSKKEILLIEIASRLCGGYLPELILSAYSVNLYVESIKVLTDANYVCALKYSQRQPAIELSFHSSQEGHIIKIEGIDEIMKLDSYICHDIQVRLSQKIYVTKDMNGIPLSVYFVNSSVAQLEQDIKRAKELFKLVISETSET
ncbi:ATP-grasp domain-containing protein (plasmid) [Candidatus Megaera polyxenophila]|uniref:ATP-grasp domain-containing protein n=1 Tax=Candidatus Megaera polyxenophila TaxID=988779 RepID=UPI00249EC0B5|nr:ATP-grasp domain-containing protein [Candidatus Megaera polyxenophila]